MPSADKDRALVTATEAKNKFGLLLEKAMQGGVVVITKHDAPKAVLISMDEYTALASAPESRINTLSAEFDSLLMRMQRTEVRKSTAAFPSWFAGARKADQIVAGRKRG